VIKKTLFLAVEAEAH